MVDSGGGSLNLFQEVATLLSAGGIMHLIDRFFLLRKDRADAGMVEAEAESTISAAWKDHVMAIQDEAATLREMVENLWAKRRECEDRIATLSQEIITLRAQLTRILIQNPEPETDEPAKPRGLPSS